jgi:Domain found in Dishevelled, Egl-10, and Pleckstrin (DEP)
MTCHDNCSVDTDLSLTRPKATKQQYSWDDWIVLFVQHTAVEDRTVRYQKYRNVFIGSETIDSFLYHNLVKTRREAVIVGRILMRDYHLFHHVPIHGQLQQDFRDDNSLLYRFDCRVLREYATCSDILHEYATCSDVSNYDDLEGSNSTSTSATADGDERQPKSFVSSSAAQTVTAAIPTTSLATSSTTISAATEEFAIPSLSLDASFALNLSTTYPSSPSPSITIRHDHDDESLYQRAQHFIRIATVRDRYYHLKKYPKVFVGSEVVTALVEQGICPTRTDAVQLGRQLERELCLFHHVVNDHRFADEWYFYQYHTNLRLRNMLLEEQQSQSKYSTQQSREGYD